MTNLKFSVQLLYFYPSSNEKLDRYKTSAELIFYSPFFIKYIYLNITLVFRQFLHHHTPQYSDQKNADPCLDFLYEKWISPPNQELIDHFAHVSYKKVRRQSGFMSKQFLLIS